MSLNSNFSIHQSGSFIFSKSKPVSISVDNFLLVTFHSSSSSSTGVIVQALFEHRTDFLDKLDTLFEKYSSLPDVDPNRVRTKVFGATSKFNPILTALKGWLDRHQIPVVATDLGRVISSEVVLEPQTGRVGVQYQTPSDLGQSVFLSEGTARDRKTKQDVQVEILLLSLNASTRTLAKQAIEEQAGWQATCPVEIKFAQIKSLLSKKKWLGLIISDELQTHRDLELFLKDVSKSHQNLPIHWIGAEIPKSLRVIPNLKLLPPLEPFLIPQFKKSLQKALMDFKFSSTSETLAFSKKSKTK